MPHIDVQLDHHMVTVGSAPPLWPKAELTAEPSLSLTPTTPPPPRPEALADALAYAGQHGGLSAPQLAAALSGVRVLAKVTGRSADQLPAAPQDLTPVIQDAFPARHRIRPKRWANAVSAIRALLRACGLHAPVAPARPPSCPAWATLVAAIPTQQERSPMLGFARWCSDAGIHPAEVTEQTVENYSLFRQCQTIRTGLIQVRSSIRRIWNRCVRARLPGWPSRVLIAPQPPNVEALPLSSFPVSFQSEIASLMSRQTHPDAFDPHSGRWRPGTASAARRIFIRAASLEARRRGGPEHVTGLADIVTTDTFEFVMRHLYERSNRVWREYAATFATYLAVLARDFVQADAATLARIQELRNVIIKRVREHRKPGLSERVHGRLMPFDDPRLLRRFFMLPGELYRVARMLHDETPGRRAKKHPVRAAQMHEQALMLDLLEVAGRICTAR